MDPAQAIGHPRFLAPPPPLAGPEPWRVIDDDGFFPNEAMNLGYENLAGRESMPLASTQRMEEAMQGRWKDWADLMNERYLFKHTEPDNPDPAAPVAVYENRGAYPRARLLGRVRRVPDQEAAFGLLADPSFDPRREAILESGTAMDTGLPQGSVQWLDRSPNAFRLRVDSDRAGLLLLSNAWYPSWRCSVDGEDRAVLRADGGLQGVLLEPGAHELRFRFDTELLYRALAACLAGVLLLLGLAWMEGPGAARA
jgi:hypothetical protein